MEGRNGRDIHVVKEGDRFVTINNHDKVDIILFGAKFDEIVVHRKCGALKLTAYETDPHKIIRY